MNVIDKNDLNEAMNKAIVYLRIIDDKTFTFGILGRLFGQHRTGIQKRELRNKAKYPLPEKAKE